MSPGIIALVSAVAVGVALSVLKSRFDGRFRGTRAIHPSKKEPVHDSSTAPNRDHDDRGGAGRGGWG